MEYPRQIPVGAETKGVVAALGRPGEGLCRELYALLDIRGLKCAGALPAHEITPELKVGDEVEVLVQAHEDENGLARVSRHQLQIERGWSRVHDDMQARTPISFTAEKLMRGGVLGEAQIGDSGALEAFLPASRADVKRLHQLPRLIGQSFDVIVVEAERERGNLIVSQTEAIADRQEKVLQELQEGQTYTLKVSGLASFGAFLDLGGGLSGLLHASEITWKAGRHNPKDFLSIGDEVEVMLTGIRVEKEETRIAFSKRRLVDPWHECGYQQGDLVSGRVANVRKDLGSFISLGSYPRVVGLLRDGTLKKGDRVQVRLASFDAEKQRARLELVDE